MRDLGVLQMRMNGRSTMGKQLKQACLARSLLSAIAARSVPNDDLLTAEARNKEASAVKTAVDPRIERTWEARVVAGEE